MILNHRSIKTVYHQLTVPRHRLGTYDRRAFAVAGPMVFNAMPDHLRDPSVNTATFARSLKTHLFTTYQHAQRLEVLPRNALYKSTFSLTYLYGIPPACLCQVHYVLFFFVSLLCCISFHQFHLRTHFLCIVQCNRHSDVGTKQINGYSATVILVMFFLHFYLHQGSIH